jgi:WD40 repeat protein
VRDGSGRGLSHSGRIRREIEVPESDAGPIRFSPDGQIIAASTSSGRSKSAAIRLFRLRDKQEIRTFDTESSRVTALTFTSSGTRLVAALFDTTIVLWDVHPTR